MQKKLVQSSLALTAAAALGLGSAFVASPALADGPQKLDVQNDKQVQKALSDIGGVNAYGTKGGKLNIGVSEKTDEIKELEKKYDNVVVTEGIKELKPYAANDIVGGAGYLVKAGSGGGACSTGFSGWDGDGNPIILTAGHCAKIINQDTNVFEGDTTVNETERPSTAPANGGDGFQQSGLGILGQWGYNKYGGDLVTAEDQKPAADDIDFAVINVDASKYNVKTGVSDWSDAASDDLSTSLATDITKVGSHTDGSVQKAGRTTGLTEAPVWTDLNEQFEFMNIGGRFVHGFGVKGTKAAPFSAGGDSGGGVFQGDTAVGVISGGGDVSQGGVVYDMSWVADLDYSLETSGETITFEDPSEVPEAPAAPTAKNQTIEPNGDVVGKAAANADVKIKWSESAGTQVSNQMAKSEPQGASAGEDTVKADAEGNFTIEGPEAEGKYSYEAVAVVEGQESEAAKFSVTVEAADEAEADATAEADAAAEGDDADADTGAEADAAAEGDDADADTGAEADAAAEGDDANADSAADGDDANADSAADGDDADAGAAADAKNAESNADSDGSKDGEAPAEREISISPKEVAASDFVKKDKGVQIKVEGFEEGEKVSLEVVAGPKNVEGITLDETANKDGVAAFSIYGTNASDPSAYLGQYDVQVTGANDTDDEKALTGSFDVVADEDGNGGGSDDGDGDGGDGGSDLPRTGAELTGLAAGAGLLVVGGAAVVLTMRRNKKN